MTGSGLGLRSPGICWLDQAPLVRFKVEGANIVASAAVLETTKDPDL